MEVLDNPSKFYVIFSTIIISLNVIGSVIGFSGIYNICAGNISTTMMQSEMMISNTLTPIEASEKVQELLHNTVLLAVVIKNIAQALILTLYIPLYQKHHEAIF